VPFNSRLFFAVTSLLIFAGCVAPALDESDYRYKASLAVEDAHSSLEAADLSVQLLGTRNLPIAQVEVLVRESEGTIGGAESLFASVKPPSSEARQLRERILDLLDRAIEPVTEARIALQSGDRRGAVAAMSGAKVVGDQLKAFADELSQ
jgi:hypothetical protein